MSDAVDCSSATVPRGLTFCTVIAWREKIAKIPPSKSKCYDLSARVSPCCVHPDVNDKQLGSMPRRGHVRVTRASPVPLIVPSDRIEPHLIKPQWRVHALASQSCDCHMSTIVIQKSVQHCLATGPFRPAR
ncbi:hypothetical protein X777_01455 [Ooceraea biroi]|uniref:Uncharacterized protein n=1 Tax=Ooceraea biroi TaxID=2015173 RepID=A0A026WSK6_OOCBI|nr:hypothetical protein X777_01455 [Ooceraea biroi]